ncbi:hypothetical protein TGME49_258622 [Toxoplasma gondii ME49]|uniref:Uncharacterized protein n=3 Tax=Toxoplasma gondii TaxID=5811 RepID=A0A125YX40_TOXGV|nr:hypothetical protein TGME49_258622 [Toxoplasma gondii ME49]EPT29360.1 hypothetical protein TGME49_258622 [Toxoplasma gondii ME49]ESS32214.1 hypothetical protein TGVEG_258622 [Toxoplasma gondii VEG]KYF41712.1 hypothetical protein TGARI_258622 [Toxoplasma gondii ARI]|eukprot:XP_018637022.1 hypothetical protein TGME49_258622 [Toxoplasma gondii ME49]
MVLSDVAVILIDTEEELSNSSHVPVSTSLNPPSDGDRGEQEKPHRSRDSGRPNEIRATENAESKEMNSQTVHDDEKESAELAPEEPKRQVKASLEEDRVDDIHVEKVQYRELRALQKHQEDHLAMLINQVRQQQEELAARSRLLEEQHQELILMREHFIQITARGRLPDAKGTKPSNNVAPEDSSLVVPDSNDKKKESNGEDAAQRTASLGLTQILQSGGRRQLQGPAEMNNMPIQGYICKVIGHPCSHDEECCEDMMCTQPSFIRTEPQRPDSRGTCQRPANVAGFPSTPAWMIGHDEIPTGTMFFGDHVGATSGDHGPRRNSNLSRGFMNRLRVPPNSRMLGNEIDSIEVKERR